MKITFAFLCFGAVFALGGAFSIQGPQDGENGWWVPQLDGSFQWMNENEIDEVVQRMGEHFKIVDVKYYLYTETNPTVPQRLYTNNVTSLEQSNFNSSNPTRFIIHGWQNNFQSDMNILLTSVLLSQGSFNVIVVDWSDGAETINYIAAANRVSAVGQNVGGFVDFLNQFGGLAFSDLHVIGHSLGAHVSGFAGKTASRGKINAIIGLDPALPLFRFTSLSKRLSSDDAAYVETIHTNGGKLGFELPIGVAAFYPNGGKSQPGCGYDIPGTCAHSRAYQYYAEALSMNNFATIQCKDHTSAVKQSCGNIFSNIKMGSPKNIGITSGVFYAPVNEISPYGVL